MGESVTQNGSLNTHEKYMECVKELNESEVLDKKAASLLEEAERIEDLLGVEALLTEDETSVQTRQMEARDLRKQANELVSFCNKLHFNL